MSTIRENRLFLGNPGTGKSTLINCLLGANHMQSGLSWGGGLSQDYQRFEKDGIMYMDAPGLADETIQLQAAQAITKALKQSGKYKLFFLVRLQNGRVVSEDLVTLERVLDSIDAGDLNYKFTIVINCVGERQFESLVKRGDEFKTIKTLINRRYLTESFCFIPRIEALEEKSDAVVELPQEVRDFLDNEAPVVTVEERQVKPITLTGFAQQSQAIKSEIEKLRNDQAALLRTMREQEKRHDEAMKRMRASHAAELERLTRGNNADVAVPYTGAGLLSPRGNHDYRAMPLTPPVGEVPSNAAPASWFSRRKRLVAVIVGFVIVLGIVVGVVVSSHSKTPTPTPSPPSPTPAPKPTAISPSSPKATVSPTLLPTPSPPPSSPAPTPTPALGYRYKAVGCVDIKVTPGTPTKPAVNPGNFDEGYFFAIDQKARYFMYTGSGSIVAFNSSNLQEPTVARDCVDKGLYVWKVIVRTAQ